MAFVSASVLVAAVAVRVWEDQSLQSARMKGDERQTRSDPRESVRDILTDYSEQMVVLRLRLDAMQKAVYDAACEGNLEQMRQMKLAEAEIESSALALCYNFLAQIESIDDLKGEDGALLALMCVAIFVSHVRFSL